MEEPEEDCDMEDDNSDERTRYIPLLYVERGILRSHEQGDLKRLRDDD